MTQDFISCDKRASEELERVGRVLERALFGITHWKLPAPTIKALPLAAWGQPLVADRRPSIWRLSPSPDRSNPGRRRGCRKVANPRRSTPAPAGLARYGCVHRLSCMLSHAQRVRKAAASASPILMPRKHSPGRSAPFPSSRLHPTVDQDCGRLGRCSILNRDVTRVTWLCRTVYAKLQAFSSPLNLTGA